MCLCKGFLGGSVKKNPPANAGDIDSIPGLVDSLVEEEMATHTSSLAWKIPGTEKPRRLQSMGLQRVRHNWVAFELWCWRRLLRVPWTARRSNQSILKEISPWMSLEGTMLKLKLQYFGHLMRRVDSLEKTLMLGGIEGRRRRGRQRMRWLDASPTRWTWVWVNSGSWWWTGRPGVLRFMGSQRVRHDSATELNWTELSMLFRQQVMVCLVFFGCILVLSCCGQTRYLI